MLLVFGRGVNLPESFPKAEKRVHDFRETISAELGGDSKGRADDTQRTRQLRDELELNLPFHPIVSFGGVHDKPQSKIPCRPGNDLEITKPKIARKQVKAEDNLRCYRVFRVLGLGV